ncbi:hypothetical protein K435DRAFT_716152 [Dendrothele bispora CBS 962.96]|uniref:Arrestin-like N-terminal domain-containing protein n=1 Tax=Dendrothele bispora (strain CBS 962.96) TaxID=1314807 RepID=A0A4S8MJR3_DENBC|nr:hypothetical protein K435DRAFT_716152 [Dendrothele bispora CBS 962.96]
MSLEQSTILENTTTLPPYSVASPPPSYSSDPACGEQSIQLSPRSRSRPTGTFTKKSGSVTVILMGQDENASTPTYGRQDIVSGFLSLESREAISEVRVKLVGQMVLIISEGGSQTTQLFEQDHILWRYDPSSDADASCPSTIPFMCRFPSGFSTKGHADTPLPPSLNMHYPGTSSMMITTRYTLKIKVVKARHPTMGFWTKVKRMAVSLDYLPRTRPPYSISPSSNWFSDLKIAPEQWHQTVAVIKSRSEDIVPSIDCNLFIPSSKVYSLSDSVPFHVNLTGPLRSLREFLPQPGKDSFPIHVHLLRQICVEVNGAKAWRNSIIGDGAVRGIPPPFSNITSESRDGSLDWEGEIKISKNVHICGFNAGDLAVKDFIVLSVSPTVPKSFIQFQQISVNIRLATESAGADVSLF